MGGNNTKPAPPPPPPQPTLEDTLLDMRMTAKRFNRESTNAVKAKDQFMNKARQALQKGD
jgi:hypothetical protein